MFLAGGFGGGAVIGVLYFVLEPVLLRPEAFHSLSASPASLAALYMLSGAVIGLVAGAIAAALAMVVPLRPLVTPMCITGFIFTIIFLLRHVTREELASVSAGALTSVSSAVVVWGVISWPFVRRRPTDRAGKSVFWIAGAAVFAGGLLMAWGPLTRDHLTTRVGASRNAPDVVLIVVDALRRDHLSAFGYERPTSPFMRRLAEEGVLFERAYSHGNRTSWAMPALFTSLYPAFSGSYSFGNKIVPLPADRVTIAEMLCDTGYTTVGMMSNVHLTDTFGMTQGFDLVEDFNGVRFDLSLYRLMKFLGLYTPPQYVRSGTADATEVTNSALRWAARVPGQAPLFLFLHYMDVHHAYNPPVSYRRMFESSAAASAIDPKDLFAKTRNMVAKALPIRLSDVELQRLIDLYDAEIRVVDDQLRRLVGSLRTLRPERETIVVLTSDHGDEFMEHGKVYHTNVVTEELIRVPLIIWRSSGAWSGRRVDALVRHVDVMPTIADLAGAGTPSGVVGTSLVPVVTGDTTDAGNMTFAEGDYCTALIEDGWKVMYVDTSNTYTLYELAVDSCGMTDVAAVHPDRLRSMKSRLDEYMTLAAEARSRQKSKLAEERVIRQLRSLGYVK